MKSGKAYLVGAGPGDPGLLTLKGRDVLALADVVIYDYLANEELLKYAPAHAERIYVGKKGGDHTLSQEAINRLLVEKARDRVVVRLKGGDPFVFGRGGEEAQELAAAGIDFEIVPGVTAAVAVPAYAGIPLSHRDYASSMAFITGHERADGASPENKETLDWEKLACGVGTLVFFMGVKNLSEIAQRLMAHGRSSQTPVAVIRWGTTPQQQTVVGTLGDIVEKVQAAGLKPPAIIVVGEVVRLRKELNWYETKPLFGKTVLVTRAREQASDFRKALEALGARCVEFPTIAIVPPKSWDPLDAALASLDQYDWVVFTSVNGVKFFMERLWASGRDVRALAGRRLAAIGPKTAESLEQRGLRLDVVPKEYRAESLLEALGETAVRGQRFLLPRAAQARDVLPQTLRRWGAQVEVVPAYETVPAADGVNELKAMLARGDIHVVTFTASSTVTFFVQAVGAPHAAELLKKTAVACIGPITADTARSFGIEPTVVAQEYTIPGLVHAMVSHVLQAV
ncbi:uroporphyrinogen-III C-methyltransferase [Desulfosoma caldarium]|uniref:uroporphyrinogen-III C-methyltransferase n=1 Tax=Desulfosoma caldarium TaxID=610254 RepID=A0A3N1UR33_9BACT|nr:uroporphyrinogen-III C-methyltransferase [Desulfosoma caldarium]ROQ93582.1 uroporphyrinogen-III synthase /uroporphyrinogen-III C-methyltransferase [Desulfosoma caldarium]